MQRVFSMTLWLCIAQTPTLKEKNASLQWALGAAGQILVAVYTLRGEDIRLISARHATRREIREYEG
jgi:uncharacterized protein